MKSCAILTSSPSSPSSSPSVLMLDLDDLEKLDSIAASPQHTDLPFCWCGLLNENSHVQAHLDDCDLHPANQVAGGTIRSRDTSEPRTDAQRRKHRECVARIRHKMRASIASLQAEQSRLEQTLRHKMALTGMSTVPDPTRLAYVELVREQIALEYEREELESTLAHREQYQRLAQRELEKTRTFRAHSVR